jgi:phosphopantetheine--protein transferase-like protein
MIGIDIVEVRRIKEKYQKGGFADFAFTKNEREFLSKKGLKIYESAAGIFAAKEAAAKALEGFSEGLRFLSVEILHDEQGKPYALIDGKDSGLEISISHSADYAVAVALKCNKL